MPETYPAVKMFNAYVANISTSIGWGGQGGSMQMTLVEDPKTDAVIPKFSRDGTGVRDDVNGIPFTGEDPSSPKVGTACYFKYRNFYFGGIFQRWTYQESVSGGRTYTIVLESPTKLMDGVQLITGKFNGMTDYFAADWFTGGHSTTNLNIDGTVAYPPPALGDAGVMTYRHIKNVYQLFGFYENYIDGYFGSSTTNDAGMPANAIIKALDYMAKRYEDMDEGINYAGGPITIQDTEYSLNIDSVKNRIDNAWGAVEYLGQLAGGPKVFSIPECYRIRSENLSLNGFISEMAKVLNFDYYYEVRHSDFDEDAPIDDQYDDGGAGIPQANIVLRTVGRGLPPTRYAIQEYIEQQKTEPGPLYRKVVNYDVGEEYADSVTQRVVVGGPRTRYNWIGGDNAYPCWGTSDNKTYDPLTQHGPRGPMGSNKYQIYYSAAEHFGTNSANGKPSRAFVQQIPIPIPEFSELRKWYGEYYIARLFELRLATGGREIWDAYKTFDTYSGWEPNGYWNQFTCPWSSQFDASESVINGIKNFYSNINAFDTSRASTEKSLWDIEKQRIADATFALVESVAKNYYCKKFAVPILIDQVETNPGAFGMSITPQKLWYIPPGEFTIKHSWETTQAAFVQDKLAREFQFFDDQGRQKSMTGWSANDYYDYSALGSSWSFGGGAALGTVVSHEGGPEAKQYFDFARDGGQRSWVIYDTSQSVLHYDQWTTPNQGFSVLVAFFYGIYLPPAYYVKPLFQDIQLPIPPDVAMPNSFGIPQKSNRLRWGPWIGGTSFKGQAEVQMDDSLAPETFGGYLGLNFIGVNYAIMDNDVAVGPVETGTIKVVGAPEGALGERFSSVGPYVTNMSINVDPTGGVTTTYRFNTWTPKWGTLAKYNIDRVADIRGRFFKAVQEKRVEAEKAKESLPKLWFPKTDKDKSKRQGGPSADAGYESIIAEVPDPDVPAGDGDGANPAAGGAAGAAAILAPADRNKGNNIVFPSDSLGSNSQALTYFSDRRTDNDDFYIGVDDQNAPIDEES